MNKRKLMAILKFLSAPSRVLVGPIFLNGNIIDSIEILDEDNYIINEIIDNNYTSVPSSMLSNNDKDALLDILIKILCVE